MSQLDQQLAVAAMAMLSAAEACKTWELGGDPAPVGETADIAYDKCRAVTAILVIEGAIVATADQGASRRARLVTAAEMLCLAGIDEGGTSEDLEMAAALLRLAINA
jgi:hypothetical protein